MPVLATASEPTHIVAMIPRMKEKRAADVIVVSYEKKAFKKQAFTLNRLDYVDNVIHNLSFRCIPLSWLNEKGNDTF